jgi:hypothetical protein
MLSAPFLLSRFPPRSRSLPLRIFCPLLVRTTATKIMMPPNQIFTNSKPITHPSTPYKADNHSLTSGFRFRFLFRRRMNDMQLKPPPLLGGTYRPQLLESPSSLKRDTNSQGFEYVDLK